MLGWLRKRVRSAQSKQVIEDAEGLLKECGVAEGPMQAAEAELRQAQIDYRNLGEKWQTEIGLTGKEIPEPLEVARLRLSIPELEMRISGLRKHLSGLYMRCHTVKDQVEIAVREAHESQISEAMERLTVARAAFDKERGHCLQLEAVVGRQFLSFRDRYDHDETGKRIALPSGVECEGDREATELLKEIDKRANRRQSIARKQLQWGLAGAWQRAWR